jgi:hypothetical protein
MTVIIDPTTGYSGPAGVPLPRAQGGTGATDNPAFSAYQSSAQTLPSGGATTKLQFQSKEYDTGGCFNNTAGAVTLNGLSVPAYSFMPSVAGYYLFTAGMRISVTSTPMEVQVRKNASILYELCNSGTAALNSGTGSALVLLNGTTDYVDIQGYIQSGQALVTGVGSTYFQAFLARSV